MSQAAIRENAGVVRNIDEPWGYRPEIDGIRAIAVIAVLLSHLQLPYFGGGYIGVDMFFVISGYVIYGDYLKRRAVGTFSIRDFLKRRLRRLGPQLLAMLAAVLIVGALILLPSDFQRLPARLLASATGTSNWLFAAQSGYFMPSSEWNPLLHAWTLSVEIQFYLAFPFIVVLLARLEPGMMVGGLSVLLLASLLYCLWPRPDGALFYDSFARSWEFLLGSLLHHFGERWRGRTAASLLAAIALFALAATITQIARDVFYPDWRALVPTLAVASLILTLRHSVFGPLFTNKGVVQIGRMSYSIYIWHWPIIVFATYIWPGAVGLTWNILPLTVGIISVSLLFWTTVEKPMRWKRAVPPSHFFRNIAFIFLTVCTLSVLAWAIKGWPQRFDKRIVALDGYTGDINPRRTACHSNEFSERRLKQPCAYGASTDPEIAFWSDSHGVELVVAVTPWLKAHGKSAAQFSFSSCAPRKPEFVRTDCERFNERTLSTLLASKHLKTVVLAGATDDDAYRNNPVWEAEFTAAARALLAAGKRVVIIYPIPGQRLPGPRAMANALRYSTSYDQSFTRTSDYLSRTRPIFRVYDGIGEVNVVRVYPHHVLCDTDRCSLSDGQRPLYFDDSHLGLHGAQLLVPTLTLAMDS